MRWSDGLGGLFLMLAAMLAIVVFALPIFQGQRLFAAWAVVAPVAAIGGAIVWFGRTG